MPTALRVVHEEGGRRVLVTDSLTACDATVTGHVVVGGSFAGSLALAFALERGARGVVAHEAGVGRDGAGISGLPLADRHGVAAAAVATLSARLGDGDSVLADGIVSHANATARALGVAPGMAVRAAARAMLAAEPRGPAPAALVDRTARVVAQSPAGRVVLVASMGFATAAHRGDVLCAGSHGGRVNATSLLAIRPRGALFNDGGLARDRSGVSGLAPLAAAGVPAAAVDAWTARIGDPLSTWADGVVSVVNEGAARAGVRVGDAARTAALRMLEAVEPFFLGGLRGPAQD
ncbi:MAG TPA: hypothetical protein VFX28_23360 [Methylomirabilota bacterium]|nr:hypothetical protein [Methylomirabilota bacterium]